MKQIAEVVTMGECMTLVYPDEPVSLTNSTCLRLDIAGAESNLSIALARLGHKVRLITRIGQDPFGERMGRILQDEGVIPDAILPDGDHPTGLFFREWLPDGQRRVFYYRKDSAASYINENDLKVEWFTGARFFHLTGITPALSASCHQACQKFIQLAKQANGIVSFDPNFRPRLWDAKTARKNLLPFLSNVDILLMGHEDGLALFETEADEPLLRAAASMGPRMIILKRAERGALALVEDEIIEVPAYRVEDVVDPVGAGDGFDAGFLAGLLRGWDIETAVQLGAKIGALAVTQMGDYHGYPLENQVIE